MWVGPPRHPALRGVISVLWIGEGAPSAGWERVIPTGSMHLAWRACGTPIRFAAGGGGLPTQVARAGVVGGTRDVAHVRDTPGARSVGALLVAGAAPRLFGEPARALAGLHVGLDDLWGRDAARLQERLARASDAEALALVEAALVARLRPAARPPGLSEALRALDRGAAVGEVAAAVGRTPRALGLWFDDAVGLSPVAWRRVRRLQRALALAGRGMDGAGVARGAGFADQAHLCRELAAIAGVSLTDWRARASRHPNHVPLTASDPSKDDGAVGDSQGSRRA